MQAGGRPFHSPKLQLHQGPITALEGGRNFGSPGNADKGLSSAQRSAGVGMWTAFRPIQRGFSSPFLIRKESPPSLWCAPLASGYASGPVSDWKGGNDGLLGWGLQTVAESCPVYVYLRSPGVCLRAGTESDAHHFFTPTLLGEALQLESHRTAWNRRTGAWPRPSSAINSQLDPSKSHLLSHGSPFPHL